MIKFNLIEKKINTWLRKYPKYRNFIKRLYLNFCWWGSVRFLRNTPRQNGTIFTSIGESNFFGYFDICPENSSGLVLVHAFLSERKEKTSIDILVISKETGEVIANTSSFSWNWQQGTRAQWLDKSRFIYNDYCKWSENYVSKIYNLERDEIERILTLPVQSAFKNKYLLSLNVDRLATCDPDYSYNNRRSFVEDNPLTSKSDGIWFTDLNSGTTSILVTFETIFKLCEIWSKELDTYTINHVCPSPSGEMFVFIFRSLKDGQRVDRLMLFSLSEKKLTIINHGPMISHFAWKNDHELVVYASTPNSNHSFIMVNVENGAWENFHAGKLDHLGDGHPTIFKEKMILDTYPNRFGIQKLFQFNFENQELKMLDYFFHSPRYYGRERCDLHPRFSKDGSKIYLDSVTCGGRRLHSLDIDHDVI